MDVSRVRWRAPAATLGIVLLAIGCDGGSPLATEPIDRTPVPTPPAITTVAATVLEGQALAALGPDGRFASAAARFPTPFPTLSAAEAESVAVRFLRVWGESYQSDLSAERGAPISVSRLRACGAAIYAESGLAPVADSIIATLRIHWGPYWEVLLCDGEVQQVIFGIGAYATTLTGLDFSTAYGGPIAELLNASLSIRGIPVSVRFPSNAEEAAARVAAATGRKVSSIPRLVRARTPLSGWWAMWSVSLDSAVMVRGSQTGVARSRAELLFGLVPYLKWEMAVVDEIGADQGPYVTTGEVRQSDGSLRTIPLTLARLAAPSFSSVEPVTRVASP